jgi:hypothetical protein
MKSRILTLAMVLLLASSAWSALEIDVESGALFTGYNDARIPGDEGTLFSLNDDLQANTVPFVRARLTWHINARHHLSLLYAPLTVESSGTIDRDVVYQDAFFPANTSLDASYTFNSYRATWRYDFVRRDNLTFGMGFTAKIRDAVISLESADTKAEKKNVGFVPIINFRLSWHVAPQLSLICEGDALAAPQGRAEDVALSLQYDTIDNLGVRLGYRLLEGGSDNDEVYTFALFHYAVLGLSYRF